MIKSFRAYPLHLKEPVEAVTLADHEAALAEARREVEELKADMARCTEEWVDRCCKAEAEREEAVKVLQDVGDLINASCGVAGLHLNGDVAPWSSLKKGGQFEDWLFRFSEWEEKQSPALKSIVPTGESQELIKPVRCRDCGIPYSALGLDLVLPDQQWNRIAPEGGILCANCICERAKKAGGTVILAWMDHINAPLWMDEWRAKAKEVEG